VDSVHTPLIDDLRALLAGRLTGAQVLETWPELASLAEEHGGLLPLIETFLPQLERAAFGVPPEPGHFGTLQKLMMLAVGQHAALGFPEPDYEPAVAQRIERLVQDIVDALQAVVPAGVTLVREGLWAGVAEDGRLVSGTLFGQELDAEGINAFVCSLANLVQDYISEETTWPWPSYPDDPTSMALPDSAVEGGVLTIWFGDARFPMIKCTPISLDGVL
jgi:hypothetical protein